MYPEGSPGGLKHSPRAAIFTLNAAQCDGGSGAPEETLDSLGFVLLGTTNVCIHLAFGGLAGR